MIKALSRLHTLSDAPFRMPPPSAKERKSIEKHKKQSELERQIDTLRDRLKEAKDKDHDFTPDDTTADKHMKSMRDQIKNLQKQIKALP